MGSRAAACCLSLLSSASIHVSATLPHTTYGTRDAPLLSVLVAYHGPEYARNLSAKISVTNAFVQGQRGTDCSPRGREIRCQLLPVANGSSAPLNVLLTALTAGIVHIRVSAVSAYGTPVLRSAESIDLRVLPCIRLVRTRAGTHCR